jgi:hypothetical protein
MYSYSTQKAKKSFTYHLTSQWCPLAKFVDYVSNMLVSANPSIEAEQLLQYPAPYSEMTRFPLQKHINLSSLGVVSYLRSIVKSNRVSDFTYIKTIESCTFSTDSFESYYKVIWEQPLVELPYVFNHTLVIVPYLCPPQFMDGKQVSIICCTSLNPPSSEQVSKVYQLMARTSMTLVTNVPADFTLSLFNNITNYPITYADYSSTFTLNKALMAGQWLVYISNLANYANKRVYVPLIEPVSAPVTNFCPIRYLHKHYASHRFDIGYVKTATESATLSSPYRSLYYHAYTINHCHASIDQWRRSHLEYCLDTDPHLVKNLCIALFRKIGLVLNHVVKVTYGTSGPDHMPQHVAYVTVHPVQGCTHIDHVSGSHYATNPYSTKSSADAQAHFILLQRLLHASITLWKTIQ